MKIYTIGVNEAGQRFDKYLFKMFRNASAGLLYKQIRCKNITLNGKKAKGNELLALNDSVCVYMSDETIAKFTFDSAASKTEADPSFLKVVYENDNIILADKPAGVLSQKSVAGDVSMNEYLLAYLLSKGMTKEELAAFTPAFCNRLDRNTSGLMIGGKTLAGLQKMSAIIKERSLSKYYIAVVSGKTECRGILEGWLAKDERTNKVTVKDKEFSGSNRIVTEYETVGSGGDEVCLLTLLKLKLITGKTHQLRAQLASAGHPILGDPKYGNPSLNRRFKTNRQMLHSYMVVFPQMDGDFSGLSGKSFCAPIPETVLKFCKAEGI